MYNYSVRTGYFGEIKAVAFDIDGTLYKELPFNLIVAPYFIFHLNFFLKYNKVRKELRLLQESKPVDSSLSSQDLTLSDGVYRDFRLAQASLLAEKLKCTPEQAQAKIEKIVYSGLKKFYEKLAPYSGAVEFIRRLKENNLSVSILSDFPPEQKGEIWGIKSYCDFLLGSEQTGALKPSSYVFEKLREQLNISADEILYVGNNYKYDICGSKNAGMKAAWIVRKQKKSAEKISRLQSPAPDLIFTKYSDLEDKFFNKNI